MLLNFILYVGLGIQYSDNYHLLVEYSVSEMLVSHEDLNCLLEALITDCDDPLVLFLLE